MVYASKGQRATAIDALREEAERLGQGAMWEAPAALMRGVEGPDALDALVGRDTTTLGDVAEWLVSARGRDADTPGGSFGIAWSWLHSELWSRYRQDNLDALYERGRKLKLNGSQLTRERLEAWAVYTRLSSWLDVLAVDLVYYYYYYSDTSSVPNWSVADVVSSNALWACYKAPPQHLRERLRARLKSLTMHARGAQAGADPLPKVPKDSSAPLQALMSGLGAECTRLERLVTSLRRATAGELTMDPAAMRLSYYEKGLEASCGRVDGPEVSLELNAERPALSCACPYGAHRPCGVKLTAGRAMYQALCAQPKLRAKVSEALVKPVWQRWLDGLMSTLEGEPSVPTTMDGEPAWFGWRVEGESDMDVVVKPALARGYKRGGDGVITRPLDLDVDEALADIEDPRDRELVRIWSMIDARSAGATDWRRLLKRMEGHPRVYHHDTSSTPLRVEVQRFSISATHGEGGLGFEVRLGDELLSVERMWEVIHEVRVNRASMRLDRDAGVLTIVEVPDRMVQAAELLDDGVELPQEESRERLLAQAPRLTASGALTLGEGLRGREVTPIERVVARLGMDGSLKVTLRAEPLPGGPMVEPGEGPEVLFGVDGEGPLHCVRDTEAELRRAREVSAALGLDGIDADEDGWRWLLEVDDVALDLVSRLREHEGEMFEVRWDSSPIRLAQAAVGNLKLQIEGSGRDWFSVGGALNLDEGAVPLDQLLKAAREQRRWVEVDDGRWVLLEERLRRNLDRIAEVADPDDGQISALAAPQLLDAQNDGVEVAGPQRWLTLTQRIRRAAELEPELPEGLNAELRPYQQEGFAWMARLAEWAPGACLADDMGLGKTLQALALLLRRAADGPQLVVAPTSVSGGWKAEAARFAPTLDVEVVRSRKDLDLLEWVGPHGVLVTSYDLVARYIDQWSAIQWKTVVWDEAQALKNPTTRRARSARELDAEFMLALTGTPIENHTGELWSIFRIVLPGLLGGQTAFRRRFQTPIERHNRATARRALASLVAPFVLRRLKSQVARDLPERTDVRINVELSRGERRLYDELRRAVLSELDQAAQLGAGSEESKGLRFKLLAAITRLRQLACHPRLYNPSTEVGSSKLEVLREKVDEMREEGHQALIFSQFTSLLKLVREGLEADGVRCAWLDGSLKAVDRQKAVEAFQGGEADVFLLSIKAGGTGLNLTAASYVFLLDPWWNPAVEDQATDRAHRIGQTQPVTVYRLVAAGTIEESIYAMHETKRALMDAVMAGAGSSRALSPEELRQLIAETTGNDVDDDDDDSLDEADEDTHHARSARRLLAGASGFDSDDLDEDEALEAAGDGAEAVAPASDVTVAEATAEATAEAPAPQPAAPVEAPATEAPPAAAASEAPRNGVGEGQAHLEELLDVCLDAAVTENRISQASARVYRNKLVRMIAWLIERGHPRDPEQVRGDLKDTYREELESGAWEAPRSDLASVTTTARWLAEVLSAESGDRGGEVTSEG